MSILAPIAVWLRGHLHDACLMVRLAAVLVFALMPATAALGATCTSAAGTVNWNTVASWNCGRVPAAGDAVIVPSGSTVTLNVDTNALASLQVNLGGTITLLAGANFDIYLGGNLINNGSLNLQSSTGTNTIYLTGNNLTSTFSGSGTWLLDNLDLNGKNPKSCTGACKVEISDSPNLQFYNNNLFSAVSATNTFNALGNSTATVTFNRPGNQTVAIGFVTYPNLVLAGSGNKSTGGSAGTATILGDLTISGGVTFNTGGGGNPPVNLAGDFTNSGTFTSGSGSFTFNGTAAQTVTGAATFQRLAINNAVGVALASGDVTVSNLLTLSSGALVTGSNTVVTTQNCNTPSVTRTGGFVDGNLQKKIPGGASACTFEIGSGASYAPMVAVFPAGTGGGNMTASTTGSEHPALASSDIDPNNDVNRYWTLTNGGVTVPAAGFSATLNYVIGTPVDLDPTAAPANFIVERWDGTNWFPPVMNATCTATPATNLCKQVNGLSVTALGDFAIGDPLPGFNVPPGAFNTFETSTPAGAILGHIYTKIVGSAITLQVVAVNATRTDVNTTYNTNPITVELLDARNNTGAITAGTDCRSTWTTIISTQSLSPVWTNGRSATITITTPVNAWRDVRGRITQGVNSGCSTDRFVIRPPGFTSITSNMNNNATSGPPSLKTGQNFTINALTGLSGYDNGSGATLANPQIIPLTDNSKVIGSPNAGAIGGSFGAASSGTASGAAFYYSEVGNFGLAANAIYDNAFTAVDQPSDCAPDFSNSLVGGKYGCYFGSPAIAQTAGVSGFGRFIPDNFNVTFNTPAFGPACGNFSYVGQTFSYATAPVMTVAARNGTNNGLTNATTLNYAGVYVKMGNATLTPNTQAARYTRFDALGGGTTPALNTANVPGAPGVGSDPVIGAFANGVGTLTFSSGTGLFFTRSNTTPNAPFDADIALALNVIDSDSVAYGANPAAFGAATAGNGIAFTTGRPIRFGRLSLGGAFGSELFDLPIALQTQYYNGSVYVTNVDDSCTTLAASNLAFVFNAGTPNLVACETSVSPTTTLYFTAGKASAAAPPASTPVPALSKPGPGNNGVVDITVNLGAAAGNTCLAGASGAATGANKSWLQWKWSGATYDRNPSARASFGTYKNADQLIYLRENF